MKNVCCVYFIIILHVCEVVVLLAALLLFRYYEYINVVWRTLTSILGHMYRALKIFGLSTPIFDMKIK